MDKKYLKQVAIYLLTSLVSVGLIVYIGYHLFYGMTQKVETAPAAPATIQSVVEADMFIFREETLLKTTGSSGGTGGTGSSGGSIVPAVADGVRVGIGDTAVRRYDVSSPDIVAAIAEADMQIAVLTSMLDNTLSLRDTAAIDGEIYEIMQKIASAANAGDAAAALSHKADLRTALSRRSTITSTASDIEGEIARVQAERTALTRRLGTLRETVSVSQSGYFYADPDGYESLFTANTALQMTPAEFRSLTEKEPAALPANVAGKLVTDYVWYAACLVPAHRAGNLTEGQTYTVSFPYNGEAAVTMTLTRAVRDGEYIMLVFSTGAMPPGFSYTRSQPAVITDRTYTGLKVPASAVRVVDGVTGVYVREGSVIHFRAAKLLVESKDFCLFENKPAEDPPAGHVWLTQNEIVITKGRGLTEGRVLS